MRSIILPFETRTQQQTNHGCFIESLPVAAVNNVNQHLIGIDCLSDTKIVRVAHVRVVKVILPVGSDLPLPANVPYIQPYILGHHTERRLDSFPFMEVLGPGYSFLVDLFMLKPWVGVMWVMSSEANFFRIVVLPALSKPCKAHPSIHTNG